MSDPMITHGDMRIQAAFVCFILSLPMGEYISTPMP
jgi:hypothetical protein